MATGDETQAGPRPSLPPRRPPGLGDDPATGETQRMGAERAGDEGLFPSQELNDHIQEPLAGFGGTEPEPAVRGRRAAPPKPQILAPQANEWETNMQEVEVVKGRRTGLVLLFLLALLLVAIIALALAALSVLRDGDDLPASSGDETTTESTQAGDIDGSASAEPTTTVPAVPDPNQFQVVIVEEPFICDGGTREFAKLSGAAPDEEVAFSSPQSPGLRSGTADANGELPIRWVCDPDQAGTTWELTATGAVSGKSATFIFAGATQPTTPTTAPAPLIVNLIENPFVCNGETRIFGGLTGAAADEQVAFTSPQASNISSGTADANGALSIRWVCDPEQAGTTWELTATGVTSGRTVTFSFVGS